MNIKYIFLKFFKINWIKYSCVEVIFEIFNPVVIIPVIMFPKNRFQVLHPQAHIPSYTCAGELKKS